MSVIESIVLGVIQGLTEYLPVSSTGHLTVAGKLMNLISMDNPERWTAFIAVIQLGTLMAVLVYFFNDIKRIAVDFTKENVVCPLKNRSKISIKTQSQNSLMGWYLILATLPVAIVGLLFKDFIEGVFTKNLYVIASSLILLALILFIADKTGKYKRNMKDIKWYDALIIGLAQTVALIPGSSRSGTTITAGLFLGLKRETAARFSFLMSIPAVLASGLYELYSALEYIDARQIISMSVATITSAIVGYLSIEFLLRYLKKNTTLLFVVYRICAGLIIFLLLHLQLIGG
ncbi:putative undecaprenol kinase [Melioribacter roseus P3M-2]|uniref:Undecaprenyl-diphosphatase n=1 Tax=Melioribacter roseus (strain DSM 23840 / JCM 17771 / VKM B-2668 / P3M-2) TaxID=1191523 RepID=I6YWN1_MELRP|nr:undecaprenyl-diphosphatase UppP [Melioribacter roseus]AFN74967.1 putative undecaprenol kinase [Melioribacter roseus P3M-2]